MFSSCFYAYILFCLHCNFFACFFAFLCLHIILFTLFCSCFYVNISFCLHWVFFRVSMFTYYFVYIVISLHVFFVLLCLHGNWFTCFSYFYLNILFCLHCNFFTCFACASMHLLVCLHCNSITCFFMFLC